MAINVYDIIVVMVNVIVELSTVSQILSYHLLVHKVF